MQAITGAANSRDDLRYVVARAGLATAGRDEQIREMIGFNVSTRPDESTRPVSTDVRVIAPGVVMTSGEFERRFGEVALGGYRDTMDPAVFAHFVRFAGLISGRSSLDMVQVTDQSEDPR